MVLIPNSRERLKTFLPGEKHRSPLPFQYKTHLKIWSEFRTCMIAFWSHFILQCYLIFPHPYFKVSLFFVPFLSLLPLFLVSFLASCCVVDAPATFDIFCFPFNIYPLYIYFFFFSRWVWRSFLKQNFTDYMFFLVCLKWIWPCFKFVLGVSLYVRFREKFV